jgi:hypothetical protein
MNKLSFFLLCTFMINCKSNKIENYTNKPTKITSICPEDGVCNVTIHKNKSLEIKKDNFNKIYYQLIDNEKVTTYIFSYQKKTNPKLADDSYLEEILFEIQNTENLIELKDENLNKIKLIMGRHKFERSNNIGYFEVLKGKFILNNHKISINIETDKPFLVKNILIE